LALSAILGGFPHRFRLFLSFFHFSLFCSNLGSKLGLGWQIWHPRMFRLQFLTPTVVQKRGLLDLLPIWSMYIPLILHIAFSPAFTLVLLFPPFSKAEEEKSYGLVVSTGNWILSVNERTRTACSMQVLIPSPFHRASFVCFFAFENMHTAINSR
jgi:hypothetical protein